MAFDLSNRKKVLVALDNARTTGITTIGEIANGEVVLATPGGNTLQGNTGGTTYTQQEIQVVLRKDVDGEAKFDATEPFKASQVEQYVVLPDAVDTEFLYYIGYNGTTGALEEDSSGSTLITEGNTYGIRVRRLDTQNSQFDSCFNVKTVSAYANFTGYAQVDLATELYEQMVKSFYNEIDYIFKPELIYSGAGTVLGGTSTLAVTEGSDLVTASSASHGLVAGDYVRIGGTALTTSVYKVKSVATTTITLTTKYLGSTATVANANCLEIDDPTTGDWGIKLSGRTKLYQTGRFYYDVFNIQLFLEGFENTPIDYNTKPVKGSGTYEEVADMEWQAYESGAQFKEDDMPPRTTPLNATSGKNYDLVNLMIRKSIRGTGFVQSDNILYSNHVIAIPTGNTQGDSDSAGTPVGIVSGLDAWLTDLLGTNPFGAQVGKI